MSKPWHGVLVATALPWDERGGIDHDRYAEHVSWLADSGCDGVIPNGSLGEYQVLSTDERAAVVHTAVEAAPAGFSVVPGVAAYGADEARRWAEQAAEAGASAVMLLPPNSYRAPDRAVVEHYAEVATAGLPIVAYNNPIDTKVDLTPELLARLHAEGTIVGVKEFSGDVRRAYQIAELAPDLDLLAGADDVALELAIGGAKGWIAGFPNALPAACVRFWRAAAAGDLEIAKPLYQLLHPLLRWDSRVEFVQAIKYCMDLVGRYGGPCRAPRVPLTDAQAAAVREATQNALAAALGDARATASR
jgi:dihydrodipicolinate synthase/N-acetylneuraminate lyase